MELARALASKPKLLLLDECLAGLTAEDIDHMISTLRDLRKDDLTIIIIEHTIDAVAKLVDRMIVLNYGAVICAGPPAVVLKDEEVITAYLGKRWAAHAKN
jgi:branched-chain amino acid transport system permease protein